MHPVKDIRWITVVIDGYKADTDYLGNIGRYIYINVVAGSTIASKGAGIFRNHRLFYDLNQVSSNPLVFTVGHCLIE